MGFLALKFYLLGSVKLEDFSDSFRFAAGCEWKLCEIKAPAGHDSALMTQTLTDVTAASPCLFAKIS